MKFEEKNCQGCPHLQSCEEVYRRIGQSDGPPVTFKVIIAFLLPLVIFILCLALFDWLFGLIIESKTLSAVLSLLVAVCITLIYVMIVKDIRNNNKNLICKESHNEQIDS